MPFRVTPRHSIAYPRIPFHSLILLPAASAATSLHDKGELEFMTNAHIRLLGYDDLIARGLRFSKPYLWKLERAGRFPKRVSGGRRLAWIESEIDDYLRAMITQRDGEAA
jgi:prophage regulatory protein